MKRKVREILNRDRSKPCLALAPRPKKPPDSDPSPVSVEKPPGPAPVVATKPAAKPPKKLPVSDYWDAEQVAAYLVLGTPTILHGKAGTDKIPRIRFGRCIRWKVTDVIKWAEEKHQQAVDRLRQRRRWQRTG